MKPSRLFRRGSVLGLALVVAPTMFPVPALAGAGERAIRTVVSAARQVRLTPEQRAEIRAVLTAHRGDLERIAVAQATARAALRDAIHQPELNERAVRVAAAAVAPTVAALSVERAEIYSEVAAVLSDEQRATVRNAAATVEGLVLRQATRTMDPEALLSRMNLTDAQKQEIAAILEAHRPELEALVTQYRDARNVLRGAIQQPTVDSTAVTSAAAEVSRLETEIAVERAEIFSEVSAVLTPEQRAELAARAEAARERIVGLLESLLQLLQQLV